MNKIILKSLILLCIISLIIYKIDHYFAKSQHVFLKHHFFYEEESNSIDILILGDSHTYCGVSSDIIQGKTGLKSYNHGIGGVNFHEVYFNLLEALKYQSPKLVIVENYPFFGVGQEKKSFNENGILNRRTKFSAEGKKIGFTKIMENKVSMVDYNFLKNFNIFKYHENWTDFEDFSTVLNQFTTKKSFPPFKDSAKDIAFMSNEIAEEFKNKQFKDSIFISDDHEVIINKILKLSKENNFKLLFVTVPFYNEYYKKTNEKFKNGHEQLKKIIKNYDTAKLLDINPTVDLNRTYFLGGNNVKTFNYNNQHLNYKGNIKTSNIISNFINNNYDFNAENFEVSSIQDVFYSFNENLKSNKFDGELLKVNNRNINVSGNLINRSKDFEHPIWSKGATKVVSDLTIAPDGSLTADNITGTGLNDGYILQAITNNKGIFTWSVWLKGIGTTRIRLQEEGGDYSNYETLNIDLTSNWAKYSLSCKKEEDGNGIRGVISGIQTNDNFSLWGAELLVESSDEKQNNEIIVNENEEVVSLNGWMFLNDEKIENKFIALKKDSEFSYISLPNQVRTELNDMIIEKFGEDYKDAGYNLKIPKAILEKGKYEVFHIARTENQEFYIQKVNCKLIIN